MRKTLCRSIPFPLVLTAMLSASAPVRADLNTASEWKPNRDGGNPPAVFALTSEAGVSGLRIVYRDKPPHWGNIRHPIRIPPDATGIRCRLRVLRATPGAALHFWLLESDRDGWVTRVWPRNKDLLAEVADGRWIDLFVPFTAFRFSPRGDKKPEFLTANRMLIGCNFGDFTLEIAGMSLARNTIRSMPPPRSADVTVRPGPRGTVAILNEPTFERRPSHPDPGRLAELLHRSGFGTAFLRAGDLTDPEILDPTRFQAVVLPCAPWFPQAARKTFIRYLRHGGAFFSIGGYAFDRPAIWDGKNWTTVLPTVRAADITGNSRKDIAARNLLNTRYGIPGDTMRLTREQIGVFDPSYLLLHVQSLRTAPGQYVCPDPFTITRPLEGFAAAGLTGSNSPVFPDGWARLVPVLEAADRFGRRRGPVLSLMLHYAGPWRGSAWAFTGVTNTDLFDGTHPGMDDVFVRTTTYLVHPLFLYGLSATPACVRRDEKVEVRVRVFSGDTLPSDLVVRFECGARKRDIPVRAPSPPTGEDAFAQYTFDVPPDASDFVEVRALLIRRGMPVDEMRSGVVVRNPQVRASGPDIRISGNCFTVDGRPVFLCGTNQTGMMWYAANENPLTWRRDFRRMADFGVNILRILHFSPFARDQNVNRRPFNPEDLRNRPRPTRRKTDAIVQTAAANRIGIFLTCHDWMPVELTDEQLAVQRDWNRFWARRYRDVPSMLYDIQNEPSARLRNAPHIEALFRKWLKKRYGSVDNALKLWSSSGAPAVIDLTARPSGWTDLRARDLDMFRAWLFRRWVRANVEGVREGAPHAPVTVGYLQNLTAADKFAADDIVDFTCTHFYGTVQRFRGVLKMMDRRIENRPFTLGEFGARKAHDARTHGKTGDPAEDSVRWFLAVGHYALGMGAALIANWDWKDMPDCVFPWGINHPDLVPKPVLEAYRNMALLFRFVQPRYEPPPVWLVIPDSNRFGYGSNAVHTAILRAIEWLMDAHAAFGLVNEDALDRLPKTARALVWPVPYCPDDKAFACAAAFVERGGALLFTGDIRFSPDRRPDRLDRTAGIGFPPEAAPAPVPPFDPAAAGLPEDPVVGKTEHGLVWWIRKPVELVGSRKGESIYRSFLSAAHVPMTAVDGLDNAGEIHVFEVPTSGRGLALLLYNDGAVQRRIQVRPTHRPGVLCRIDIAAGRTGFVLLDHGNRIIAAESDGLVSVNDRPVFIARGHMAAAALDGKDIRESERVLLLPFSPGAITLHHVNGTAAGYIVETGEFRNGRWVPLERTQAPVPARSGRITAPIDADTAFDLRLLAPPAALPEAARTAADLLYLRF